MRMMNVDLLKEHEGLRLDAYVCPGGVWTIGWGHTRTARSGQRITFEQAYVLLREDLAQAERCVRERVTIELTQGMFDALVSFTFNVGCGALQRSTLLRKLNKGDIKGAAAEFPRWRIGGGRVLPGLVRRRADEQARFLEVDDEVSRQPTHLEYGSSNLDDPDSSSTRS